MSEPIGPPPPRSALLDWFEALKTGKWKIGLSVLLGWATLSVIALIRVGPTQYESVARLVTEPDLLEQGLARMIGAGDPSRDRAITDAATFERAAVNRTSISRTLERLSNDTGHDVAHMLGLPAQSITPEALQTIRERHFFFDYEISDPQIVVRVRAGSPDFTTDLARFFIEEALAQFELVRGKQFNQAREKVAQRREAISDDPKAAEFLDRVEAQYAKVALLDRPRIIVLDEPSPAILVAHSLLGLKLAMILGALLGLGFGLLWLAVDLHRAAMRELNPGRYGPA